MPMDSQARVRLSIDGCDIGFLTLWISSEDDFDVILSFDDLCILQPQIDWVRRRLLFRTDPTFSPKPKPGDHTPNVHDDSSPSTPDNQLVISPRLSSLGSFQPHNHEFVSAPELLRAARTDAPIGVMLISAEPSSLPLFGFVPTGADAGVEGDEEPVDASGDLGTLPQCYAEYADVFCEVEADKLPPHTGHDLEIEIEPGSKPPQGPLYLKGPKEMEELRRYIDENISKGFIRPSRSPARSPVLFVPKKDGGLRLCVITGV